MFATSGSLNLGFVHGICNMLVLLLFMLHGILQLGFIQGWVGVIFAWSRICFRVGFRAVLVGCLYIVGFSGFWRGLIGFRVGFI